MLDSDVANALHDVGELPAHMVLGENRPNRDSRQVFPAIDPGSGQVLAELPQATESDVDHAVACARTALSGPWGQAKPVERARLLHRLATHIRSQATWLATIETLDSGKPLREALGDIETSARYFEYYAGIADKLQGDTIPLGPDYMSWTINEPVGVTAHIIPWNFPLVTTSRGLAPALAAGCTAVIKPAEHTSLTSIILADFMREVGFPDGVCNVVLGFGHKAGNALVSHPDVDHVTFTGSVGTGASVMSSASQSATAVTLELGGKSPLIALSDADTNLVVEGACKAILLNAGQVCSAGSRLVVSREISDEVVSAVTERIAAAKPDHGLRDGAVGSIISPAQVDRIEGFVDRSTSEGVEVLCGGRRAQVPGQEGGNYFEPTVLQSSSPTNEVVQEEIFGPVLTVQIADNDEHALSLANGTRFGLVAGVYASDIKRALAMARDVCAGQVFINEYFAGGVETPFGGNKMSGFGREKGLEAIKTYLRTKCITARL